MSDEYPDNDLPDQPEDEYKSKSQVKRELKAITDFGRTLVDLPGDILEQLDLADKTLEAIEMARGMKRTNSAFKRQVQHLGKLLRDEDLDRIHQVLDRRKLVSRIDSGRLDDWQARLLAGDNTVFDELLSELPGIDRQHLSQLVRNAVRKPQEENSKAINRLRQYLKQEIRNG